MDDLKLGMELEGVVTNITAFGAFVDVGVHQDGLVHISQLADKFVTDPHQVVNVGDKIQVRVLEVDLARKRIALTARSGGAPSRADSGGGDRDRNSDGGRRPDQRGNAPSNNRPGGTRGPQPQRSGSTGGGARPATKDDGFRNNPFAKLLNKS